jgi:glucose/arabinose dehydrogenase/mono/diheme cytochrome c family protein
MTTMRDKTERAWYSSRMLRVAAILLAAALCAAGPPGLALAAQPATDDCAGSDGGLLLPPGFCATVFADNLGHARHLVVAPDGVVYVNTWSGAYYRTKPPPGGFVIALKDTKGDGHADLVRRFGDGVAQGSAGGTGIAIYNNALYVEQNDKILRYRLKAGSPVPSGAPAVVVSGLPLTGDHPMHPFVIDANGKLFVDVASATNACDVHNRMPLSPGHDPCTELQTRGGIWRYDATRLNQKFSAAQRYATGIRNGEGMSFDSAGRMYVTQHGRDQLAENWQDRYTPEQGHELPAEEVLLLEAGADYGWPKCYFDGLQQRLVLAPEYGGDGGHAIGVCAQKRGPVAFFPAHWAPDDLVIYNGAQFPAPYHGGAFIAFHGSWNRAPSPQAGYNVAFLPLADGHAAGNYIVFADGFAGAEKAPGRAEFRPTGLAVAPDGALFVSDDERGRIWRITWRGGAGAAANTLVSARIPPAGDGQHDARRPLDSLPLAPGVTREQLALGDRVFHGEAAGGTCSGCHASDGKGTIVGADLTTGHWLWSDGSPAAIARTIAQGVATPKVSFGAMPPLGGAQLSTEDVTAVAAYVWAIGHRKAP